MSPGGFSRSLMNDCVLAAPWRESGPTLSTGGVQGFALIQIVESVLVFAPGGLTAQNRREPSDPPRQVIDDAETVWLQPQSRPPAATITPMYYCT